MKAWTDYPLSNKPDHYPEFVEVEVLAYDRNKYVVVEYDGRQHTIKAGYLYSTKSANAEDLEKELAALPESV